MNAKVQRILLGILLLAIATTPILKGCEQETGPVFSFGFPLPAAGSLAVVFWILNIAILFAGAWWLSRKIEGEYLLSALAPVIVLIFLEYLSYGIFQFYILATGNGFSLSLGKFLGALGIINICLSALLTLPGTILGLEADSANRIIMTMYLIIVFSILLIAMRKQKTTSLRTTGRNPK